MDPQPPPGASGEAQPRRARNGAGHYSLPGPLHSHGDLPVAPSAPRIPRALRAFNGMPPEEPAELAAATPPAPGATGLTIRDLLEDPLADEGEMEDGRFAGLRTALRRLRRQP